MVKAPPEVAAVLGADAVHCEECRGWHHRDYHSPTPFRWGRRVRLHVAWLDTKQLARSFWNVVTG